jgi:hypothetical protein
MNVSGGTYISRPWHLVKQHQTNFISAKNTTWKIRKGGLLSLLGFSSLPWCLSRGHAHFWGRGKNERSRLHLPLDTRLEHPPYLSPSWNEHFKGSQLFLKRLSFLFLWDMGGWINKKSLIFNTCSVTHRLALLSWLWSPCQAQGTGSLPGRISPVHCP